jgi:hypothetical protein
MPSVQPKMSMGAQNMKTGPNALATAEKRVWVRKTLKRDPTPSLPSKMSPGTQNMKTEPNALGTAENKFGSAKHENGIGRPRYCRKRVRERKT